MIGEHKFRVGQRVRPSQYGKDCFMREFLRASAEWSEANRPRNEWPWGGPRDEDDDYYFVAAKPTDTGSVT